MVRSILTVLDEDVPAFFVFPLPAYIPDIHSLLPELEARRDDLSLGCESSADLNFFHPFRKCSHKKANDSRAKVLLLESRSPSV